MCIEIKVWGSGHKNLWSFDDLIDIPPGYVDVPVGDPLLTRRLKARARKIYVRMEKVGKHSKPCAYIARKKLIEDIRKDIAANAEAIEERCARGRTQRAARHQKDIEAFAEEIQEQFPNMPEGIAEDIAEHAIAKGTGRVGRNKHLQLCDRARLATVAYVRHEHTDYDNKVRHSKEWARGEIRCAVSRVLDDWRA